MKLSDYIERKKELEDAKNRVRDAEKAFNKERQARRQEIIKKIDPANLKSWVKSDIGVVILVLILFGIVQFQFSNLQVPSSGDNVIDDSASAVAAVVDPIEESVDVEVTGTEEVKPDLESEPEFPVTEFSLKTVYNNEEFSTLGGIVGGKVSYQLIIENLMTSDITCQGSEYKDNVKTSNDFSLGVKLEDLTRSITSRVTSDPGDVKIQHKVTCYPVGTDVSEGTEKTHLVKLTFI